MTDTPEKMPWRHPEHGVAFAVDVVAGVIVRLRQKPVGNHHERMQRDAQIEILRIVVAELGGDQKHDPDEGFAIVGAIHGERIAARTEATALGYTGDECPECHNLTMVRNGTCLKCTTCGATSGCS